VSAILEPGFEITFHGVRGSTPCHGDDIARYGGNTSCVSVDVPGHDPLMFDLGTGARYFGNAHPNGEVFRGSCLLSHLHWDHIQGLPFFPPLLESSGNHLTVHAPVQDDGSELAEVMARMLCPPLFPIGLSDFPGDVEFVERCDEDFALGEIAVKSRLIPHLGSTLGYRVEWGGASVAYISDHQQPGIDVYEATDNACELVQGADVLIHDAQYTRDEFIERRSWGHCTIEYAIWLAQECGAKTLVLFHHDPRHADDELDELFAAASDAADIEIVGAREGLTMRVGS
jgi:phosphoribosyl 1,2-cyclic phosphodiesterase